VPTGRLVPALKLPPSRRKFGAAKILGDGCGRELTFPITFLNAALKTVHFSALGVGKNTQQFDNFNLSLYKLSYNALPISSNVNYITDTMMLNNDGNGKLDRASIC